MKCDLPIELLSGYLDGELDPQQARMVEEHLKACRVCRMQIEELRQLDGLVRTAEVEEPTREFIFNMNRRVIDRLKKRRRFSFFRFAPVLVPVAVAALVLIVLVRSPERTTLVDTDDLVRFADSESRGKEVVAETPPEEKDRTYMKTMTDREPVAVMKEEPAAEFTAEGVPTARPPEPVMKKAAAPRSEREAEISEDAAMPDIEGLFYQYDLPEGQVVRAIVDTTGRVVRVATGNTIVPQRDSVLENRLQGQQLAPDRFKGTRARVYLDFINQPAEEETTETCTE